MKLINVVNARQLLDSFAERQDINTHLAYWMTKFVMSTQSEYEFYANEMRKIIKKYNENEDGDTINIPKEKIADFDKEVKGLQNTDVEAPNIKFSLTELSNELRLSMQQIYLLFDFIEEDK